MVESKRFYCKKDGDNEWEVCDRLKQFSMPVSLLEFCGAVENALNVLWGEICRLENHSQELVQRSIKYEDTIDELKNENKRLKEEIRLLDIEDERWTKISEEDKETIKKLNNENEQLKQQLEDCLIKKQKIKVLLTHSEPILEQKKLQKLIYNRVIAMIDEKIKIADTYRKPLDSLTIGDDLGYWNGAYQTLKELKKELQEYEY